MIIDEKEVAKAIGLLKEDGEIFEIRVLENKGTYSAYFNDIETALRQLKTLNVEGKSNVYICLQKIKNACYSRAQKDKFIKNATPTTGDTDIEGYNWLFIDLDPVRPSGTSSSEKELNYAKQKANAIILYLRNKKFREPIVAISGNGVHLLYKIEFKNEKTRIDLIKKFLETLHILFSDEKVDIDMKNYNPARICKLYGTMAEKGSNTKDRPYRESKIVKVPQNIESNDIELIKEVVKDLPVPEKKDYKNYGENFNLENFIQKNRIQVKKVVKANGVTRYILEQCLFNPEHKAPDSAIIQLDNGAIAYKCFHNSCNYHKWQDVRLMYEPDAYNKQYVDYTAKPNYSKQDYKVVGMFEENKEKKGFLTVSQINEKRKNKPQKEYITTGFTGIDTKMIGLIKGGVSVISGKSGGGKSSFVSNLLINMIGNGYKVALYSGELDPELSQDWINLQLAGDFVKETNNVGFYEVPCRVKEAIDKWAENRYFVYENEDGHSIKNVMEQIENIVKKHKTDVIILDNLMTLDTTDLSEDQYRQQSIFVDIIRTFAKRNNIHIIFVAHPKKNSEIIRVDDILGSSEIRNKVDNAFIVHLVNDNFKKFAINTFDWGKDKENELYKCTNILEIAKDRYTGAHAKSMPYIPLYFDGKCKRMKNTEYENKHYEWEEDYMPF